MGPLRVFRSRVLPHGYRDAVWQLALFFLAYNGYQLVRGLVDGRVGTASWNATKIISLERTLHVFVEPTVQTWATAQGWLIHIAVWAYLNCHYFITFGGLIYLYLRRNDAFYFVRNMFMVAMGLALVGYAAYPTAPPRLMPEWGFTDSIQQLTHVHVEHTAASALLNLYAAVPSMHVCFALLIGLPLAALARRRFVKVMFRIYPLFVLFVVVATGNHYLFDAFLGAVTAGIAWLAARRLAQLRPGCWAFGTAEPPPLGPVAPAAAPAFEAAR